MRLTYQVVKNAVTSAGFKWFIGGIYNINLVGIRSKDLDSNNFNDFMCVAYCDGYNNILHTFPITTDPGIYYRENPCNVNGTAILAPGQHRGLWKIGKHKGKYPALVQNKEAKVYRDNDQDDQIDFNGEIESGIFGINCHHARYEGESRQVDKWSAGCQVFANYDDHKLFMDLCARAAKNFGSVFSYTLLEEEKNFNMG